VSSNSDLRSRCHGVKVYFRQIDGKGEALPHCSFCNEPAETFLIQPNGDQEKEAIPTKDKELSLEELIEWFEDDICDCYNRKACEHCKESERCKQAHNQLKSLLSQKATESRTPEGFPKIVCLCGSTRFTELMLIKQWELTKQGFITLSWCALPDSYPRGKDRNHIGDQEGIKEIVDELHMRKIDIADEVLILNVGGYIGESTQNELDYAREKGKPIRFLEPEGKVEK